MPEAEKEDTGKPVSRSTTWILLWFLGILLCVIATYARSERRSDHFRSTIAALRDSSVQVRNERADSSFLADEVFYAQLSHAADIHSELGSDTLGFLLSRMYGKELSPLRPMMKPFQPKVAFAREHARGRKIPELFRQCLLDGFSYSVDHDTLDGLPGLLLKGHWEKHFADEKEAAVDLYVTAIRWRLAHLSDSRRLFMIALNLKVEPGIANSKRAQNAVDDKARRMYGAKYLWLTEHLPYSLVFTRGFEVRMHAYDLERDEGHVIEFHQQLFIARVKQAHPRS